MEKPTDRHESVGVTQEDAYDISFPIQYGDLDRCMYMYVSTTHHAWICILLRAVSVMWCCISGMIIIYSMMAYSSSGSVGTTNKHSMNMSNTSSIVSCCIQSRIWDTSCMMGYGFGQLSLRGSGTPRCNTFRGTPLVRQAALLKDYGNYIITNYHSLWRCCTSAQAESNSCCCCCCTCVAGTRERKRHERRQ